MAFHMFECGTPTGTVHVDALIEALTTMGEKIGEVDIQALMHEVTISKDKTIAFMPLIEKLVSYRFKGSDLRVGNKVLLRTTSQGVVSERETRDRAAHLPTASSSVT